MTRVVLALCLLVGCDRVFGVTGAPDASPPGVKWDTVATGASTTCGIRVDGTLWCWGRNDYGQLGLGQDETVGVRLPTRVGEAADWESVSLRYNTACAIRLDHSLSCWGQSSGSQIAGMTQNRTSPVLVAGEWRSVSTGSSHICGIKTDSSLWCWGNGANGRLGLGNDASQPVPTKVAPQTAGQTWKSVSAGSDSTCAIADDDSLWCWGDHDSGRLGINTSSDVQVPTRVGDGTWVSVSERTYHGCGITTDGIAKCWGRNLAGQLGTGSTSDSSTPVAVVGPSGAAWTAIEAGESFSCGLRGSTLVCWGANHRGQLGIGLDDKTQPTPTRVPDTEWTAFALGQTHACAIDTNRDLKCTGNTVGGMLGDNSGDQLVPTKVGTGVPALGENITCGTVADGFGCWGSNEQGLLGTGAADDLDDEQTGVLITASKTRLYDAGDHVCVVEDSTNKRFCWGANDLGQLGDGTTVQKRTPNNSDDPTAWVAISASRGHTCAIINNGPLYCWGNNANLQTSQPSGDQVLQPSVVGNGLYQDVATGVNFTCAVTTGKHAICFGNNDNGQLGRVVSGDAGSGEVADSDTKPYEHVFAGARHACALAGDGVARCWGANAYGQLGDGSTTDHVMAITLAGSWSTLALGELHSCGVKTDGTLWCWGDSFYGQLGLGTTQQPVLVTTPTQVGASTDWDGVWAGAHHTCATKKNNNLYCWGSQERGAVGNGLAWRGEYRVVQDPF